MDNHYNGKYSSAVCLLYAIVRELRNPSELTTYINKLFPLIDHTENTLRFVELQRLVNIVEDDTEILNMMDHIWRTMSLEEKILSDVSCFSLSLEAQNELHGLIRHE